MGKHSAPPSFWIGCCSSMEAAIADIHAATRRLTRALSARHGEFRAKNAPQRPRGGTVTHAPTP